jgi:hypothetical protein
MEVRLVSDLQDGVPAVGCGLNGHDAPLVKVHDVVVVADRYGDTCHPLKRKLSRQQISSGLEDHPHVAGVKSMKTQFI